MKIDKVSVTSKFGGAVEIYDNAIQNCDEVITNAEDTLGWQMDKFNDDSNEKRKNKNYFSLFDPYSFSLNDTLRNLSKTVWSYVDDYSVKYGQPFSYMEQVRIDKYMPQESSELRHDTQDHFLRVISAKVYLNTIQDGGETLFPYQESQIIPKTGRLVIMPSNYSYANYEKAPEKNIKYVASFWFVYQK